METRQQVQRWNIRAFDPGALADSRSVPKRQLPLVLLLVSCTLAFLNLKNAVAATQQDLTAQIPELANLIIRAGTTGDNDQDGIVDSIDVDDDNDTIPDILEGFGDTDGDLIADCFDLDSDNDGILDIIEATASLALHARLDANSDGVVDATIAVGENGLADLVETSLDSSQSLTGMFDFDGDGILNQLDLDSDNDGIPDVVEAGSQDIDANGLFDRFRDFDRDGFADQLRTTPINIRNSDSDANADYIDFDSDNDGLTDLLETLGIDNDLDGRIDNFVDVDMNGLSDDYDGVAGLLIDTDGDILLNHLDTDSDNDGLSDGIEAFTATGNTIPTMPAIPDTSTPNDSLPDTSQPNGSLVVGSDVSVMAPEISGDGQMPELETPQDDMAEQETITPPDTNDEQITLFTGESGSVFGCAITVSESSASRRPVSQDPTLMFFVLLSIMVLFLKTNVHPQRIRHLPMLCVCLMSLSLVACSSLRTPSFPSPQVTPEVQLRPYAGFGLGASFLNANTSDTTLDQEFDISTAGQLTLGVDVNRRFALEARVADLGEATFTNGQAIGYQVADLSALAKFSSGPYSVFARVGGGLLNNDGDFNVQQINPTHLVVGAGFGYELTRNWALRAEWAGHDVDVTQGQLSILYRFGRAPSQAPVLVVGRESPGSTTSSADSSAIASSRANEPEVGASSQIQEAVTDTLSVPEPIVAPGALEEIGSPAIAAVEQPEIVNETVLLPNTRRDQQLALSTAVPETGLIIDPQPAGNSVSQLKPLILKPIVQPPVQARPTPGVVGTVDAKARCGVVPDGIPVSAIDGCALFGGPVPSLTFKPQTDELTANGQEVLTEMAQLLNTEIEMELTVASHTETSDDPRAAMLLSRKRTLSIIRYLAEKGIDASRLKPEAFGDTAPLQGPARQGNNERVEVLVR